MANQNKKEIIKLICTKKLLKKLMILIKKFYRNKLSKKQKEMNLIKIIIMNFLLSRKMSHKQIIKKTMNLNKQDYKL